MIYNGSRRYCTCPKGPVDTSTPGVIKFSGCPGVMESN